MEERLKKINDLALAAGQKRLSSDTDYIHLKYHALPDEVQVTIPLVENFLFALALLRTHSMENVAKAKIMIERLLFFQVQEGNFPVYLHEYPECKDRFLAVKLLAPIFRIYHGYHHVLGSDLKNRLRNALMQLATYSKKNLDEKNPPYLKHFQIITALFAIGDLFNIPEWVDRARSDFKKFDTPTRDWYQPKSLAELIIASQMVDPRLSQSVLPGFLEHLNQVWHKNLSCYVGPHLLEYQVGFEPESTLFDLMMGYLTNCFSKRALKDHSMHLYAALIDSTEDTIIESSIPHESFGLIQGQSFRYCKFNDYCLTFIEQNNPLNPSRDKGFSPFQFVFGSPERLHTLSIEGGNSKQIKFIRNENVLEFHFHLSEVPELEDKEKCREVNFYFDLFENTSFKISGLKANTFLIGEEVELMYGGMTFHLVFEIIQGKGDFLGHFMRGNRPSQIANKGNQRFSAFDNQIFLRTIRRNQDCVIKAILKPNVHLL